MITDAQDGPFHDLDAFVSLPRVDGLRLSPDGRRLVISVGTPDRENKAYTTALWEVDPDGERPAGRLTRSEEGESLGAFTPAGDLLFVSSRPQPGSPSESSDKPPASLWVQPAGAGDARVVAAPAGGVHGVLVSRSGTVLLGSGALPSAAFEDDKAARDERKKAGVSAILHESYPVRYWDHDLGPHHNRLIVTDTEGTELRDLTGDAGLALDDEADWDIAPDGRTVVTTWNVPEGSASRRITVVAIDVATGARRELAGDDAHDYAAPRISPDGTQVVLTAERRSTPDDPGDTWLVLVPIEGGPARPLTESWDRHAGAVRWTPDGSALITTADDLGRAPVWRIAVADGSVTRVTADDGAYSSIELSPDGEFVYALRNAIDSPPTPVRISLASSEIVLLPGPLAPVAIPGSLTEVFGTAADGSDLRAWLALPASAGPDSPAPLLLWVHGGPQSSWNGWTWRWNPWVAVAQGYAVLLPDPALSTGYGYEFIRRGWGGWGGTPYTDLMTITDVAVARPDIDETRTAAMGGSFGGYMSNWIAGHTDRFKAIVTHASLWALEPFAGTTDASFYWVREMTEKMMLANSPHLFADSVTTPMLVIHGDKDYRVPIGEGLRLWWSLTSRQTGENPHKFLYFPDENHWILKPGNAKVWYATVLAFLAHHVRDEPWERPNLLG